MTNLLSGTKPNLPKGVSLTEAARQSFNPTRSEVAEFAAKREASSKAIRDGIARLEASGKW